MNRKALVALVGRPNVGKSTLFNRIIGRRLAVVSDVAGTTRDRLYADAEWGGVAFTIIDTGGIEVTEGRASAPLSEDSEQFLPLIRQQAAVAVQDAEVIVQVVDGQSGITAADREVADILRQANKPVIIAANKLESAKLWDTAYEFYELGLVIVSPIAGTTRDAIDEKVRWHGQEFTLIDTAGIRRRGKIDQGIEKYSVLRALKTLRRADVALLLIDGEEGVTSQDAHIGGMLVEENAGVIILVNKWDIVEKDAYTMPAYEKKVRDELAFLAYAPLLFVSAASGQRLNKIFPTVLEVQAARHHRMTTGELNDLMRDIVAHHPPPTKAGTQLKFYYATQVAVAPPTFVFFVNRPEMVHFGYQRYMENQIRERYAFAGTPIRLLFRGRNEEKK